MNPPTESDADLKASTAVAPATEALAPAKLPHKEKLAFLETLRGIGAIFVVFRHCADPFFPALLYVNAQPGNEGWFYEHFVRPLKYVWLDGGFAVAIFFIMSGYVLSLGFIRKKNPEVLASATIRRYLRLMLPVLAAALFSWALHRTGFIHYTEAVNALGSGAFSDPGRWYGFPPSFKFAVREGLWGAFFEHDTFHTYNNAFWTMHHELIGSFFVFAFLAIFGLLRHRWILYCITGYVFLCLDQLFPLHFLIGMGLCDLTQSLIQRGKLPHLGFWATWPALVIALAMGGWQYAGNISFRGHALYRPVVDDMIAATIMVSIFLCSQTARGLCENWFCRKLGELSFGLYLVHYPILCSVGAMVAVATKNAGYSVGASGAAATAVSLALSFVGAWVFAKTVDRWAIDWGKTLYRRVFKSAAVLTPVATTPSMPDAV